MQPTGAPVLTLALARQSDLHWPPPLQWLAPGEQARLAVQGSPERRQQFVAGRWLLRQLPGIGAVDIDAEGRSHRPQGHANLSHSGGWVLAGAADQALGVDLEVLRPRRDLMGLAGLVFRAAPCEALQALPHDEALAAFYRGWTLREAWFKARGRGLDLAQLQALDFTPAHVCAHRPERPPFLSPDEFPGDSPACDSACAVLPDAGLVLSVHQPNGLGDLPGTLAGYPVAWQRSRSLLAE